MGWFQPIEEVIYDRSKLYTEYVPPDGPPILVTKTGVSGHSYRMSVLGSIRRDVGGVLLMRARGTHPKAKYAHVSDGHLSMPHTHPLYARINELPLRYVFHYDHHEWTVPAFREVAVSCFGEPRDRRYNEYILGTQEQYDRYAACFDKYP
jgi:hypothetical protein